MKYPKFCKKCGNLLEIHFKFSGYFHPETGDKLINKRLLCKRNRFDEVYGHENIFLGIFTKNKGGLFYFGKMLPGVKKAKNLSSPSASKNIYVHHSYSQESEYPGRFAY